MIGSIKKIAALLIMAAMIFTLMPAYTHAVTSTEHVSISVSPKELGQEGDVTVTITLTNTNSSTPVVTNPPTVTNPPEVTPAPTQAPTETPEPTDAPMPTVAPTEGEGSVGIPVTPMMSVSSGGDYTNIHISNSYGVTFQTSGVTVAPGSKKTFSAKMHVSTGMIGVELPFTVSWTSYGQTKSETVTCKISRLNASPYLSVIRTANPVNASEGTEVTITYTFTNSGSVRLTNITLVDRYVKGSSSPLLSPFSLDPGATQKFT